MWVVLANSTGVCLNGYDIQLLDDKDQPMKFTSYDDAYGYLFHAGYTEEEIHEFCITEEEELANA